MYPGLIIGILISVIIFLLWFLTKGQPRQGFSGAEFTMQTMLEELEEKYRELEARLDAKEARLELMVNQVIQHKKPAANNQRSRAIRQLLAQDLAPEDIARQLGIGKGEVQLIINLENLTNHKAD